jgi:hypothetical protein
LIAPGCGQPDRQNFGAANRRKFTQVMYQNPARSIRWFIPKNSSAFIDKKSSRTLSRNGIGKFHPAPAPDTRLRRT